METQYTIIPEYTHLLKSDYPKSRYICEMKDQYLESVYHPCNPYWHYLQKTFFTIVPRE